MPRVPRLPLLALGALLLALGTTLSACDTAAGCEGGGELQVEDLELGDGDEAALTSTVTVAYTVRLADGTLVEQRDEDEPETFSLLQTIEGFRQGVVGMREGGRRRITIPPDLAWGEGGSANGLVPPCATVVFEVTLLDVQ